MSLEVLEAGFGNCIQDAGRTGYRSIGVPLSGAADPLLLTCANYLLGNPPAAPALEVTLMGPRLLAVAGPVRCALVGGIRARLLRRDGTARAIDPWETATLFPGDVIAIGAAKGPGYLGVSGGWRVRPQLGSCSTFARAGLGGMDGRALQTGDRIACGPMIGDPWLEFRAMTPYRHPDEAFRVILGPQHDHFTAEALDIFFSQPFTVTPELDRMGTRLAGPRLMHRADKGADILSDGTTPGAIQVPANGQPIVLGPDCQTVGGYPKIATLISADVPRLAHLVPGQQIRFAAATLGEAFAARERQRAGLARWRSAISPFRPPGVIDEAALCSENLLSGTIDALEFHRANHIDLPWE